MFEQQQRVGLDAVFDGEFSFLLNSESRFVIDAAEALDQKLFCRHYSWHECNQIVNLERHSSSRVGLWYNHPSNSKRRSI